MVGCRKMIIAASTVVIGAVSVESFGGHVSRNPIGGRIKSTHLHAADKAKSDDTKSASKGGAGSWRAKAKEYLDKKNVNTSDMKLNIAFVTGNAMKQKEINLILANHGCANGDGESYVNLRILDVDLPEIQGEFNTKIICAMVLRT
jgi:hypothetical protein